MGIEIAWAAVNIIASVGLAVAGLGAFAMWRWPHDGQPLSRRLALAFAVVFWFLALDEGIELHDRAGQWLWRERGIVAPGPIHHVDDVLLLGYVAVAALCGLLLLPSLLKHPRFLSGLCVVAGLLALSTVSDAVGPTRTWTDLIEESVEAIAVTVLAVVMWQAAWPGLPHHREVLSAAQPARGPGPLIETS